MVVDVKKDGVGVAEMTSSAVNVIRVAEVDNCTEATVGLSGTASSAVNVIRVAEVDNCAEATVGLSGTACVLHVVCTTVDVMQFETREEVEWMEFRDVDGEGVGCGRLPCLFELDFLI